VEWILAIIVGGIVGWLASMVMNRDASMGIFWNITVGILGGVIGKYGLALIDVTGANWLIRFVAALIGAILLLGIANLVQRGHLH